MNASKEHLLTSGPPGLAETEMTVVPLNLVFSRVFSIFLLIWKKIQIQRKILDEVLTVR